MKKTILITGCSSGIGLTAATLLNKKNYRVFATARKESDVAMLKKLGIESFMLDVNDSLAIHRVFNEILALTNGTLDVLFNNAGYGFMGAVEDLTRDMMRTQFETNVFGAMELTNLVIPIMRKQGHGRIIQNTSILGVVAFPYYGAYNASKFALEAFSHTLRQELRGTNIFVSIIAPGPIITKFGDNATKNFLEQINPTQSAHKKIYENYFSHAKKSRDPLAVSSEVVVQKLIRAVESSRPRVRYYVGIPAHVLGFLHRILPECTLDWIIYRITRKMRETG
jgi:short-subunit dehydrogenase